MEASLFSRLYCISLGARLQVFCPARRALKYVLIINTLLANEYVLTNQAFFITEINHWEEK